MDLVNEGVDAAKVAAQHEQRKRYAEAAYLYGVAAQLVREATLNPVGVDPKLAADLPRYAAQYEAKAKRCESVSRSTPARGTVPMLEDANVQRGLEAVRLAVAADNAGRTADAYEGYSTACRYLLLASADERLSPADRETISDKAAEYHARAEVLGQQCARDRIAAQGPVRPDASMGNVPFALRSGERYVDPAPRPGFAKRVSNAVHGKSEFGGTGVSKAWL